MRPRRPQHKLKSNPMTWAHSSRECGPGLCLQTAAASPLLCSCSWLFVCLGSWRCQSWGAPGCLPVLHGTGEGPGGTWHQPSQVSPRTCHLCRAAHPNPECGSFPYPRVGYPMGVTSGVQRDCLVVTQHGHMSIPVTPPLPFSLWVPPGTGVQLEGSRGGWTRQRSGNTWTEEWFWLWLSWGHQLEMRTGCRASLGSPRSGAVLHPCWVPSSEHPHHTMGEGAETKMGVGLT